jgi:hypothetical protein
VESRENSSQVLSKSLSRSPPFLLQNCLVAATNLSMGPLLVAMPRTQYRGAFSDSTEASTSKLIGGGDGGAGDGHEGMTTSTSDAAGTEMMARQMAARLAQRLGVSVFVSCSLTEGAPATATEGVDREMIQHRAAALAEREIGRLLQDKLKHVT